MPRDKQVHNQIALYFLQKLKKDKKHHISKQVGILVEINSLSSPAN